jgi:hypothetical protein
MTPGWIGLGRDRRGARPCAPTQDPAKRGIWIQGGDARPPGVAEGVRRPDVWASGVSVRCGEAVVERKFWARSGA